MHTADKSPFSALVELYQCPARWIDLLSYEDLGLAGDAWRAAITIRGCRLGIPETRYEGTAPSKQVAKHRAASAALLVLQGPIGQHDMKPS